VARKLRILFLTRRGEGYVGAPNTRHEFEQTVAKYANCEFAGEGWPNYKPNETTDLTVGRVMPNADWVIDRDNNLLEKHPSGRKYRIGLFTSDLHGKHFYKVNSPLEYAKMVNKAGYNAVFMRYPMVYGTSYRPDVFYDHLKMDKHWLPWSVNEEFFYPIRPFKYDVSFIGTYHHVPHGAYPLRKEIWKGIYFTARGHRILRERAPIGKTYERSWELLKETHLVGEDYARALGETRVLLFGCSKYLYPVQKFFEGTAAGCLVMSNAPCFANRLGFINGDTFIDVDEFSWEEALTYFLENKREAAKIAKRGREMTLKHHTHDIRAKQWLEMLRD